MGDLFEAWYPFIRADVFLIAQVHKITGRQRLIMQKIDPISGKILLKNSIDCIHTAVGDIPVGEFEDTIEDPKFEEKVLHIRSSEKLKEINLPPEEKFKAFQSWVAGIAEAGLAAFIIQGEIDKVANLQYPIALPLLRFMVLADSSFLPSYIQHLDQSSYYEGERHEAFIIANLLPLLEFILKEPKGFEMGNIMESVLSIDPPLSLFVKNEEIFRLFVINKPGFLPYYLERVKSESGEMFPDQIGFALVPVFKIITDGKVRQEELSQVVEILLSTEVTINCLATNPLLFTKLAANCKGFLETYLECIRSGIQNRVPGVAESTWSKSIIQPVLKIIAAGSREDLFEVIMSLALPLETFTSEPAIIKDFVLHYPAFLSYYLQRIQEEWLGAREGEKKWLRSVIKHIRGALDPQKKREVAEFLLQLDLPLAFFTVGLEKRINITEEPPQPARTVVFTSIRDHFDVKLPQIFSRLFRNTIISRGDMVFLRFLGFRVNFFINHFTPKSPLALITSTTQIKVRTMESERISEILAKCDRQTLLVLSGVADEMQKSQGLFLLLSDAYGGFKRACIQYHQHPADRLAFQQEIRVLTRAKLLNRFHNKLVLLNLSVQELRSLLLMVLEDDKTIGMRRKAKEIASALKVLQKYEKLPRESGNTVPTIRGSIVEFRPKVPTNLVKPHQKMGKLQKYIYKILLMGEGGVGRTTIAYKYVNGTFIADTSMTTGVQFHVKNIEMNGVAYCLNLWDFAGQDRWRFMLPSYTLGAKGAMLFYDTTRMSTLDSLEEWVGIARTQDKNLPILFLGTKTDLVEERSVAGDYAKGFLQQLGMFDYLELSSKTGENVEKAFETIVKKITERQEKEQPSG